MLGLPGLSVNDDNERSGSVSVGKGLSVPVAAITAVFSDPGPADPPDPAPVSATPAVVCVRPLVFLIAVPPQHGGCFWPW